MQAYRNAQRRARAAPPLPAQLEELGLTPAEARVLAELAQGRSTDEIAAELGISTRTMLKHGERINRKLGARDRAHAVALAWNRA